MTENEFRILIEHGDVNGMRRALEAVYRALAGVTVPPAPAVALAPDAIT